MHGVGVLHRDIKPSNVLMEGRTPILIDFGLARVADDPKLTHTGWLLGTPGYLAPEILYGDDATAASDVHSWAATVAYAGTGRALFGRGPSMAIMDRVRRGEHDLSGLRSGCAAWSRRPWTPTRRTGRRWTGCSAGCGPRPTRVQAVEPRPRIVRDDPHTVLSRRRRPAAADDLRDHDTHVIPFPHDEDEPYETVGSTSGVTTSGRTTTTAACRPPASCGTTPTRSAWNPLPAPDSPSAAGGRCCSRAARSPPAPAWRRTPGRRSRPGHRRLAAAQRLVRRQRRGGPPAAARPAVVRRRGVPARRSVAPGPLDPRTVLLALWGVARIAAALVCYAVAAGLTTTLFVCGLGLRGVAVARAGRVAGPFAAGPGGPPASAGGRSWALMLLPVLVAAAVLGYRADVEGADWTPRDGALRGTGSRCRTGRSGSDRLRSSARIARPERPVRRSVAPWMPCSTCRSR